MRGRGRPVNPSFALAFRRGPGTLSGTRRPLVAPGRGPPCVNAKLTAALAPCAAALTLATELYKHGKYARPK